MGMNSQNRKKSPMEIGRHLMMNLSDNIKVDADITGINELSEYKASSFKCTLHTFDEIKSYKQLSDYLILKKRCRSRANRGQIT